MNRINQRIIIRDGLFLTMEQNEEGMKPLRGNMIIQAGRIRSIGSDVPEIYATDEVVQGSNKLYLPGLVNTHGHAGMSLLRGMKDDVSLQVWLQQYMWPAEAKFKAEDVRAGTMLAILEMVKGGTTSFLDMYDHMDQVALAVEQTGMRACLTRGAIGLCSDELQRSKLAEAIRFSRDWHRAAQGRITTALAPHAPYTCPPTFFTKFVEAAHDLNLPMHTHLSETLREVEENTIQYGVRPVEHVMNLGLFTRPSLIAHGVHLTDEEIAILAEHQVGVSHNPGSNLKLASGIARVPQLLAAGVEVSLGTDSAASNNNLDMFEEIRLAALLHKGVSGDPTAVPATTALRMGTVMGARALWLEDVGALVTGMKADLIAIDLTLPHFQPASDLVSHLVYGACARDVTDVWVDGRALVRNRQCLTIDEEQVIFEANQALQRIQR
jgi:5-methylthioadenosine/S-adenosylhomocysteine deaminase